MVDCSYDIPLLKSLELLLATSVVEEQVLFIHVHRSLTFVSVVMTQMQVFNSHFLPNGRLGDYYDGTEYKQCSLFSEDPRALQVQLYYDEVDVCNEIGSKSTVHKLGMLGI